MGRTIAIFLLFTGCRGSAIDDGKRDLTGALAAFPGAQGFGADTPAGRRGTIHRVTTLEASGPGSLEEALAATGPRVVIFDVGGVIHRTADLVINEPFITVAGQTAPSPGITVTGAGLVISTHDVVVQHLRIRPGDASDGPRREVRDALQILGEDQVALPPGSTPRTAYNIIIDHCSLSFGTDENVSTWYANVHDVTFSHCIVSHGLDRAQHPEGAHSKGLLIGDGSQRIAVLGNLFAHNVDRNPVFKGDSTSLIVNNVIYNPRQFPIVHYGERLCCPARATVVGNVLVPGPDTPADFPVLHIADDSPPNSRVHARDNVGGPERVPQGATVLDVTAPEVWVSPLSELPSSGVEAELAGRAGARPLDRDAEDLLVMEDLRTRGGHIINRPDEGGGVPEVARTDRVSSTPANPDDDPDGNGYTNLEEWLHAQAAAVVPSL